MMKPLLAAFAAASLLTIGACTQETRVEDESSAEQAAENAGNELEQAADNAGNELEQAGDNAEDAVNDATDGNPNTNP
jgi:peptidoglycan hydrolase CwlO-like protein